MFYVCQRKVGNQPKRDSNQCPSITSKHQSFSLPVYHANNLRVIIICRFEVMVENCNKIWNILPAVKFWLRFTFVIQKLSASEIHNQFSKEYGPTIINGGGIKQWCRRSSEMVSRIFTMRKKVAGPLWSVFVTFSNIA